MLVDVDALVRAYHEQWPDPSVPSHRVAFGPSGHRGSAFDTAFNQAHILAMTEAICRWRRRQGIDGPLYLARDTHALSEAAFRTAVEVLAGHRVAVMVDSTGGYTPTPAVSHAIVTWNRGRRKRLADGIVVTPSHNPPEDGGFKYNPPSGGPADTDITGWIQEQANQLLADGVGDLPQVPFERAVSGPNVHRHDYIGAYVGDLGAVVDLDAIAGSGLRLGVDPLGGAAVAYWAAIADRHSLDLEVTNDAVDPTFRFMRLDRDGQIRMDCSSPYVMAGLIELNNRFKGRFDVAFGNDADADRHGIVTPGAGLLDPNHYLAVSIAYLFGGNRHWPAGTVVGKTVASSSMIDRVAAGLGRQLVEVPVGFRWFVDGLLDGSIGFAGEESAGASFLRRDGTPWTTDKDGIVLCLLAAEMTARGRDPGDRYRQLSDRFGSPVYRRVDAPATPEQKTTLGKLSPEHVKASELAGQPITGVLTTAPGNGVPIGGVKVITRDGWFAARPSSTENVYKVYAESFLGEAHLERILDEAGGMVDAAVASYGTS